MSSSVVALPAQPGEMFPRFAARGSSTVAFTNQTYMFSEAPAGVVQTGAAGRGTLAAAPRLGVREFAPTGFRLTLSGAGPSAPCFLVVGFTRPALPFFDLPALGFVGCALFPQPDLYGFTVAGSSGVAAGYSAHDSPAHAGTLHIFGGGVNAWSMATLRGPTQGAAMAVFAGSLQFAASFLFVASHLCVADSCLAQNTNGLPGQWLPAIAHGDHLVGCNGDTTRFYPIHASMIPTGPFQGCVLVWDKSVQDACRPGWPGAASDGEQRWAIFDPRTSPPTILKFCWRINVADSPAPPCTPPAAPLGYLGLFCAAHCWLPDGRLLVAGGDYWANYIACGANADFAGSRLLAVFDPNDIDPSQPALTQTQNGPGFGKPWTSLFGSSTPLDLRTARWYPSITVMAPATLAANGDVYISVTGGIEKQVAGIVVSPTDPSTTTHELFRFNLQSNAITRDNRLGTTTNPGTGIFRGPTTPAAGGLSFFYYPRQHFVSRFLPAWPDGRLSMAGMVIQAADADVINTPEGWNNAGSVLSLGVGNTLLEEPTTVLFPAIDPNYRDVQMVLGGMKTTPSHGGSATITNEVFFLPTRASPATWVPAPPNLCMHRARKFANAVILPDGSVVVIGGGTNPNHGVFGGGQLEAEMFWNGGWKLLADQATERTYHSWALLLPDGRVLSGGGDTCSDGAEYEILVPPYLQGNPQRPRYFTMPPASIQYGQQYSCVPDTPFGQSIDRVVLISPGSVTHGQDSNQRYEPLPFEVLDDGSMNFVAPANATLAPPGYYLLFTVSSAGVPSIGHWVRLLP